MKKMASKESSGRNKLVRLVRVPIRALLRARDYYVRRMVDCTQMSRCPGAHGVGALPRSFSSASSSIILDDHRSEDFRELVRAASVRTLLVSRSRVVRNASVGLGIGRIDEEKASEWEWDGDLDDDTKKLRFDDGSNGAGSQKQSTGFWRSKSCAVPTKDDAF